MYVCVYVCMYVCMHACMHACMYVCMHACMYVYMHACTYACMYVYMHACTYACMYVCMHACMYACRYQRTIYKCIHTNEDLQLATREVLDFVVDDVIHVERLGNIRGELRVDVGIADLGVQQLQIVERCKRVMYMHTRINHGTECPVNIGA